MVWSPLNQFEVVSLLPLNIFCFDFSATNLLLINILILFLFSNIIYFLSSNEDYFKSSLLFFIPNNWQILIERLYEVVSKLLFDNINLEGEKYFPFISVIFTFVSSLVHLYSIEYKQKFMTNTNRLFIDNLKILTKIFPIKKIQRYNQEATIVLHANNFLDGLLFFKNNTLFQFKLLTCILGVNYLYLHFLCLFLLHLRGYILLNCDRVKFMFDL
jgi:hypothetical protein